MFRHIALITVLATSLVSAHIQLQYPPRESPSHLIAFPSSGV